MSDDPIILGLARHRRVTFAGTLGSIIIGNTETSRLSVTIGLYAH